MSIDSKYLLLEEIEINELVTMLNSLPDASLLTSYIASSECVEMFANWKSRNLQVAGRLNAFFSGTDPIGTANDNANDHNLFAALSMFELAQYSLIFESWHRLKPLGVKQRLIPPNCTPKDFLRMIKNQEYEYVLGKIKRKNKRLSDSTLYGQVNKAFKFNKKALTDSLSPLSATWNTKTRAGYSPLLMLLLDVVAKYRESDTSINTANLNYGNALQGALKEERLLAHHKNKTR